MNIALATKWMLFFFSELIKSDEALFDLSGNGS